MTLRPSPAIDLGQLAWSTSDRVLAVLAHGAIAFGLFGIGFVLSLVIAGVIWLVSKRRQHVAFHGEQASIYQVIVVTVNAVAISLWSLAGVALFGQALPIPLVSPITLAQPVPAWMIALWVAVVPIFAVWFIGTILLGLYGAVQVALGRRFEYPIIGPWARRRYLRG
jgi:uncharacterized membrane protein